MNEIENIDNEIINMFRNSCEIIFNPCLNDHEFIFCKNTIYSAIQYLEIKREEEKEREEEND